jgi:hypothetical protein
VRVFFRHLPKLRFQFLAGRSFLSVDQIETEFLRQVLPQMEFGKEDSLINYHISMSRSRGIPQVSIFFLTLVSEFYILKQVHFQL